MNVSTNLCLNGFLYSLCFCFYEVMEVEKRRPKGGFLNLFDWNGKSRKKLFTNNLELDGTLI